MRTIRLLLVNPKNGTSFWGFEHAMELLGGSYSNAPLSLLTVAALSPEHWDIRVVDENVESIDPDAPCDVVGITAMNVQANRAFALAEAFRRRGRLVVMGGPFATLQPKRCLPYVDVLVEGEAENTWPVFCRDLEKGDIRSRYTEPEQIDIRQSPIPRFDLLKPRAYASLPIQTSRGCPFSCEFCDIIVMHGRRVRNKTPEQVVVELEAASAAGGSSIFFTDDNLIGSPKRAAKILEALVDFRPRDHGVGSLFTQASVNLAEHPELLELMVKAGFSRVFLGIESPRQSSLRETGKFQNLKGNLLSKIHAIQRAGLITWAGMIVGFDADTPEIFAEQAEFLDQAGIAVAMVGLLNAPPRTPLYSRLEQDGRIHSSFDWTDNCVGTNVVPLQMSRAELYGGYADLLLEIYSQERFARRLMSNISRMIPVAGGLTPRLPSFGDLKSLWRAIRVYTFSRNPDYRKHFLPNFLKAARRYPRWLVETSIHLGLWRHFAVYTPYIAEQLREAVAPIADEPAASYS